MRGCREEFQQELTRAHAFEYDRCEAGLFAARRYDCKITMAEETNDEHLKLAAKLKADLLSRESASA